MHLNGVMFKGKDNVALIFTYLLAQNVEERFPVPLLFVFNLVSLLVL
jgi:hypothetical protein